MTKQQYGTLTFVLATIAALLAFSAAVVRYVAQGEIKIGLIAAGIFILAFGFAARGAASRD
jgi:hypothetical protein